MPVHSNSNMFFQAALTQQTYCKPWQAQPSIFSGCTMMFNELLTATKWKQKHSSVKQSLFERINTMAVLVGLFSLFLWFFSNTTLHGHLTLLLLAMNLDEWKTIHTLSKIGNSALSVKCDALRPNFVNWLNCTRLNIISHWAPRI